MFSASLNKTFPFDCKLDLVTAHGRLNGPRNQKDILETVVVSHGENHDLATKPVFMDDNARSHRTRALMDFVQLVRI